MVVERHHEAAALSPQRLDRALHLLRRRRLQPGAEGEHALRHMAGNEDGRVAHDVRLVGGGRPVDQHLRLRQQQRLEPVDLGMQRFVLFARGRLHALGLAAGAHQHERCERRERQERDGEGERGDILAAERQSGAVNGVDDGAPGAGLGLCRRAQRDGKKSDNEGGEESAPPRTRTQPPVRRPDRLRH